MKKLFSSVALSLILLIASMTNSIALAGDHARNYKGHGERSTYRSQSPGRYSYKSDRGYSHREHGRYKQHRKHGHDKRYAYNHRKHHYDKRGRYNRNHYQEHENDNSGLGVGIVAAALVGLLVMSSFSESDSDAYHH